MKPTKDTARKILDLLSHGLTSGLGKQEPGAMCVEAAVNYALGLPHGDNPPCVGSAVRAFKIRLNDCQWSSNQARANGLRRIAVAQLGSNEIDQDIFRAELARLTIQKVLPIVLRSAAKLNPKHGKALEAAANECETNPTIESAKEASAAAYASSAAASASAYAAYAAYAADAAGDKVLCLAAECGVRALILAKSPGCEWLDLCDETETSRGEAMTFRPRKGRTKQKV